MISFRSRPPESFEWEFATFTGEQEVMLAHLFAAFLAAAGWEFLAQDDEGRELEWEDDSDA